MSLAHLLFQLTIAALCGLVIGAHFEVRDRPGGVRTHMLATIGAAIFCNTAIDTTALPADALRVVQGVASGVGFIGAATVLRSGGRVHGVANAASLWFAAAIGCKVALGNAYHALAMAAFVTAITVVLFYAEKWWDAKSAANKPAPPPAGLPVSE